MTQNYKHWRIEAEADLQWLYFDRANSSTNTICPEVLEELETIIEYFAQNKPKGIIIASGKTSGFIAGADIDSFAKLQAPEKIMQFIRSGQAIFNHLADLAVPTVAMIDGFCLGGGLELALACKYRIAEENKSKLGLPEVMLGIHPGWGGSVRLPALIGGPQALDLILSGRIVDARKAKKMGLIDDCVPKRQLRAAAKWFIDQHPHPHKATILQNLANQSPMRQLVVKMARKQVSKRAQRDHYPAPFAILDNFDTYGCGSGALKAEADSFAQMLEHPTSENLVRIFFLRERLKSLGKQTDFNAQRVHVCGAGTMGGDIAAWCALRGMNVTLQDRAPKYIGPALARAHELFTRKFKQKHLVQAAMDRLQPDVEGAGIARADVIIEAVFENLEVKHQLLLELEANARPDAILASNTSSFTLAELGSVLQQPERLVGIHFFNPVAQMQLVEVVSADNTLKTAVAGALAFVKQLDKLPLPVKSSPGFLVNRVLMPYLMEAVTLITEGVPATVIDKAARDFGMPMGPVELADVVGLDVCLSVAQNLSKHFTVIIPEQLASMVATGRMGKKTGQGFYNYKKGHIIREKTVGESKAASDLTQRLILRMVNEAVACLRENIVADGDLVDAAMVFGAGFAPFRGGPIHYLAKQGTEHMKAQLTDLEQRYGERFNPDLGWEKLVGA